MFSKAKQLNLNSIPALSEKSFLRYITFAALYVAQGIPEGLIFYAMPAWLAINGASPAEIGSFVGISILPWSFKLINAPIMDRFTFLPMGRKRPWVMVGQVGLLISFFLFTLISDPLNNIFWLTVVGFTVSFFGSFQDVATDGMAIDILPLEQQARANGIMWGAKMIGTSVSVALGSWMINSYSFSTTVLFYSMVILFIMAFPLLLRERPGERFLPWTEGDESKSAARLQMHNLKSIFKSLFRVFFLPASLIMGIGVFSSSTGKGLIDTVLPVLTVQELGWADTDYAQIFATANMISGILGMFIGGALIDFFGRIRMMTIFLILLVALVATFSILSPYWNVEEVVIGFMIGFYVLFVFLTIAVFATAMQLCWKRVAATQFTLYMAVSNLGLSAGAYILGPLTEMFSYPQLILAYIFFAGVMLVLLRFVKLEKHQERVKELETKFNEG
jgi:PAT family beta-lactamase induction signal transducer AmpG